MKSGGSIHIQNSCFHVKDFGKFENSYAIINLIIMQNLTEILVLCVNSNLLCEWRYVLQLSELSFTVLIDNFSLCRASYWTSSHSVIG